MNRIDTLHIHNFKFFQKQPPLKLGGNHLLLYGENGSGKSSIFWSLYTLFEASLKPDDVQIKKYFSKTILGGEDCLVNIHASETAIGSDDFDSFIELKTDDDPVQTFKISGKDVGIRGQANAQKVNYASDFINYKQLLSFSNFQHSDPINLHDLFRWNLFYYVRFAAVEFTRAGNKITLTSPAQMWDEIVKGPDEFDFEKHYTEGEFNDYIESQPFKEYLNSFKEAQDRLQELIDYINLYAPEYLIKLGYSNFDFQLELTRSYFTFTPDPDEFYVNPFKISLVITEYDGIPKAVKKPHSFLNEAKFSALAIAIRLTILKRKLHEDCLKFIVLDDLLVSLDMSNREKVLELLLSDEFYSNYQLIILTHDFSFFQLCKRKIADFDQEDWIFYEMYVDEDKRLPVLLPSDISYSKACNHLKSFDYPAAGNYFRKAAEEIFENDFPREVTIADSGERRTTLKGYIDAAIKLYERIGHNSSNLKTLDNYLFLLLNPLSHRAIDTNVYKTELSRVKTLLPEIIKEVRTINFREIIPAHNNLVVKFVLDANTQYEYFIKTTEPIYLIREGGRDILSNSKCKSFESSTITNGGAPAIVKNERYDFNNIEALHRDIYVKKHRAYDNSLFVNVLHEAPLTKARTALQDIVNTL